MSEINSSPEEMRLHLMASISESIQEVSQEKEAMKVNSLSRANPGNVAEILYLPLWHPVSVTPWHPPSQPLYTWHLLLGMD